MGEEMCQYCKETRDMLEKYKDSKIVKPLQRNQVLVIRTSEPEDMQRKFKTLRKDYGDNDAPILFALNPEANQVYICDREQLCWMREGRVVKK